MQDNKAKAVNFCLVEECDRYEARACQILCEAGGVGFFELVSELRCKRTKSERGMP